MSQTIAPGLIPPRPGLEREEPELATEHDIPPEDDNSPAAEDPAGDAAAETPRQVERE